LPTSPSHSASPFTNSVLTARNLNHDRDGATVLHDVSLSVGPGSCVGVIGPNGVGKSTLLQLLAGWIQPDDGVITISPPGSTVGYLAQEHESRAGESVREKLARLTGVLSAESDLAGAAHNLSVGAPHCADDYERALSRFESLGAGTFESRMQSLLKQLGVKDLSDRDASTLSGGEGAKVALASIELSNFDIVLLDEPTNNLDFEGLRRLERWIKSREGGTVIVSHDRAVLEVTVDTVLELDPRSHGAREYHGGWLVFQSERAHELRLAREAFDRYEEQKLQLKNRAVRQRQWAEDGVRKEVKNPRDNDKAQRDFRINRTENQAHRARQIERTLENLEVVEKPFEGWDLRFSINETKRSGDVVLRLNGAVVKRPSFQLGPVNIEVRWGDRIAVTGSNGAGKSTFVDALLGTLDLTSGERWIGPSVVAGVLGQDRHSLSGENNLVHYFIERYGLTTSETRTMLAKFGLTAMHVTRASRLLSPGERTRAELASFQARGVNLLVLDEPTNHLDLPAIEQLEGALQGYTGTLMLVSHDRRLLEALNFTRTMLLDHGCVNEVLS
jgi:ATPase subunit of ABC transporter with duplicated ATPase domains